MKLITCISNEYFVYHKQIQEGITSITIHKLESGREDGEQTQNGCLATDVLIMQFISTEIAGTGQGLVPPLPRSLTDPAGEFVIG